VNVRSWLRRMPQPVRVRLDRKKEVRVAENGKNKWRDLVDVITLEQPAILEALDADGVVIRMTELNDPDAKDEEAKEAAGPKLPPEFAILQAFGKLLLDAYVKGAEQHARAYELAFGENTKLVTTLSLQARSLQQSLEAQLAARLEAVEAAGGGEGGLADMFNGPMGPMLLGAAQKFLTAGGGEKPNGKPQPKKGA
jgi:hypothetical protein